MGFSKSQAVPAGIKPKNKIRRQQSWLAIKKNAESTKRDDRMRRKREEEKNPQLREERQARNVPATIDSKRVFDDFVDGDEEGALGWSIDVESLAKRQRLEQEAAENLDEEGVLAKLKKRDEENGDEDEEENDEELDSMLDSMLDSASGSDSDSDTLSSQKRKKEPPRPKRALSPAASTGTAGTNLDLSPDFLKKKFPSLFEPPQEPKILITTSLKSTLHKEAQVLTEFFPNSIYIRRSQHAHAYSYSVREIAQFASSRSYTTLIVLMEDMKRPSGLDVIHLPLGPHFHFSITNWVEGKKLPGHGVATDHVPELVLNNFRTPLGMLTAHLFKSLFPAVPEIEGRNVVTLHNQRDYIFVRRHRYVFREKREREQAVTGSDGKPLIQGIKVGLQEIGPRFTLKLRRIDRGVQWKSGQEWEWKARMEKQRTRFNM